jgi:hypothetical protein
MKAIGLIISWEDWKAGRAARAELARLFGPSRRNVNPSLEKAKGRLRRLEEVRQKLR